jgi:hypothetical protein
MGAREMMRRPFFLARDVFRRLISSCAVEVE